MKSVFRGAVWRARAGLVLLIFLIPAAGQAAVTGSLQVDVADADGEPLPGATVVVESPAQIGERSALSNREGVARFNAVVPGTYKVTVSFPGKTTMIQDDNVVRLDSTTLVEIRLPREYSEQVVVVAEAPQVDVTSTAIGQDLDVDFVEDLPTVRTYQTNLLLVPGVDTGVGGNPVVHGGTSRDNLFLIDGINTTDPVTQTFGANINFDIVDEQQVTTGGLRAEFGGVVGAVSNLVTKSGGNAWSGQANYFLQDDGWADGLKNLDAGGSELSAWSAAYTLGGPIVKDKAWHFTSWERNSTDIRTINQQGETSLPREFESDYFFAKVTWQATQNHRFNVQFNSDPTDIFNSNATDISINSDQLSNQTQGGTGTSLRYTGVLGKNLVLEAQATVVRNDLDAFPARPELDASTTSVFGTPTTQFGRFGNEQFSDRDRDEFKADLSWFVQSRWGEHNIKFGLQRTETDFTSININSGSQAFQDIPAGFSFLDDFGDFVLNFPGFADFVWEGMANNNPGWSCSIGGQACGQVTAPSGDPTQWLMNVPDGGGGFNTFNAAELLFPASANSQAAAAGWLRFFQLRDTNLDLAGSVGQNVTAFYAQDEWRVGRFTTYVGLRVEDQELLDSTGDEHFQYDTTFSPRVGLTYDIGGNGRQKIYAHAGRLYDPSADGLTDFGDPAGDPRLQQQLWFDPLGDFFTFFSSGGPGTGAAVVAPNLETPRTDEYLLGYAVTMGQNMALEVTAIHRKTTEVVEDLEPILGALDGSPTLEELGFGDANGDGAVDVSDLPSAFVIYNPPGGKREYDGVDVVFRKRFSNNWTTLLGYTYGEFEGNVSEDGQFGIIGDDSYLDPRLDYNYGRLGDVFAGGGTGANDHLFRLSGSYRLPVGFTVGSTLSVLSGQYYSLRSITTPDGNVGDSRTPTIWNGDPTILVDSLPVDRDAFATQTGLAVGSAELDAAILAQMPFDLRPGRGAYLNDWIYNWNVSFRYQFPIFQRLSGEAFLDVFNVLDEQSAIRRDGAFAVTAGTTLTPANVGDASIYTFGRVLQRQTPRQLQAGLRFAF